MKTPLTSWVRRVLLLASLLSLLLPTSSAAQSVDWLEAVRQCWNDAEANSSVSCYFTEGKLRGRMSPKDCVAEAIKVSRSGNRESAVRWILACRCGDDGPEIRQAISDHRIEVVRYAVDTYGAFVQ